MWLQGMQPAWYIGAIPQTSFLKVAKPATVDVRFLVNGQDIMYDGQGLVTIGNVLQSFIKDEFIGYISTLFHISDKDYAAKFTSALREEGTISKGPYLDVSDSYKTGKSLAQMIEEGEASPLFRNLEGDIPDGEKEIQINRGLYLHQKWALRKTNNGKNLIVTTGTGSGKTECFIIPIINHLLREAEEGTLSPSVRAILIYPMNALANDQMKRLRNLLKSYPDITFGVYNSSTKQSEQDGIAEYGKLYKDANGHPLKPLKNEIISRDQMQQPPPHILVTNYAMLEYMMLMPKDDLVFSGAKLRFLVLDEATISFLCTSTPQQLP